jgi:ATP10 protein
MKTTLFAVLVSVSITPSAQVLPVVRGTSVSGHPVTLPDQAKGKVAVLVIGFSRGSSTPTGAWATRLKSDFGRNSNVAIFRLAFLEEVPHMFRGLAMTGVRKSAGVDDQGTVVPVFESEAVFKRLVKYWKPDDAYILVVDRNTEIRLLSSGDVQEKYVGVQDCVNQLLGEQPNPATR